jgi:peptidoglycan hydrolase CwlO-like protein
MKLFAKSNPALVFGAALLALVGKENVSAEEATAANEELTEAGVTGAQLITEAAFNDLSEKAGRVDAAEAAVAIAQQEATAAKAAEKKAADDLATEKKRADEAEAEVDRLGSQPGAERSAPRRAIHSSTKRPLAYAPAPFFHFFSRTR